MKTEGKGREDKAEEGTWREVLYVGRGERGMEERENGTQEDRKNSNTRDR